jgi:hypothetical protein
MIFSNTSSEHKEHQIFIKLKSENSSTDVSPIATSLIMSYSQSISLKYQMNPTRAHIILPTNATSAANPLASTTPTAISRDRVVQINREGELPKYREIKTTETVLQPTLLEYTPPTNVATVTTTTVEEVPKVVKVVPVPADYVIASAGAFKPVTVGSESIPVINRTVETTVTEPVTKRIVKTTEIIETTK